MSELTSNRLQDFIERTGIGTWWRAASPSVVADRPSSPPPSPTPLEKPAFGLQNMTGGGITDFAQKDGAGATYLRILEQVEEERRARVRELIRARQELRERAREAREAKCIRTPSSS